MRASWQPLIWYLGIAVAVPLVDGAPFGVHLVTTLLLAGGFFVLLRLFDPKKQPPRAKSALPPGL
jgi:hypothetical protein